MSVSKISFVVKKSKEPEKKRVTNLHKRSKRNDFNMFNFVFYYTSKSFTYFLLCIQLKNVLVMLDTR